MPTRTCKDVNSGEELELDDTLECDLYQQNSLDPTHFLLFEKNAALSTFSPGDILRVKTSDAPLTYAHVKVLS